MVRVISGVILALGFIGLLFYSDENGFFIFAGLCVIIGIFELGSMFKEGKTPFNMYVCVLMAALLLPAIFYGGGPHIVAVAGLAVPAIWITAILRNDDDIVPTAFNTFFGLLYVTLPLAVLALIRAEEGGQWLIVMIVTANAMCDTFAYYTGRNFGKNKLAPKISPGKTIEGSMGGVVGALLGAILISYQFMPQFNILHAIAAGAIAGLIGPMGDLAESAIKRKMGVKDSGKIIPGHGGVLDRIDSLMFTSVAFYAYMVFVVNS